MQSRHKYVDSNINNVVNINSEKLFREAEDNFLYFDNINEALKQLNKSLKLSPFHYKSLIMKGDIYFIKGQIKKAIETYNQANEVKPNNSKVLGSLAVCLDAKGKYKTALSYCDKALNLINKSNEAGVYTSLFELKISLLMKLKKYEQAKTFIKYSKTHLLLEEITAINKNSAKVLDEKLKIKNKLEKSNLKIM